MRVSAWASGPDLLTDASKESVGEDALKDGSKPTLDKTVKVMVYYLVAWYVLTRLFIIVESGVRCGKYPVLLHHRGLG